MQEKHFGLCQLSSMQVYEKHIATSYRDNVLVEMR